MNAKTTWLPLKLINLIHNNQVQQHGGRLGVRDEGLLESALARPENLTAYISHDVFDLAAAYAYGIVSNHPFIDGNKCTALVCTMVFLDLNGWETNAPEADACMVMVALAQKEMSESDFAAWLRTQTEKSEE